MTPVDYRGQTTLLTGASAGIGAEFARHLAARGSDLVLVARREDRLRALAAELETGLEPGQKSVRVTVIPADLSRAGAGAELAAEVRSRGLRVTSLVNNAGFGTFGYFHEEDAARLAEEIAVDVTAVVELTR